MSICLMWPCQGVTTPIVSSRWRCVWWSKRACPPDPPAGTCGAITACLCPVPLCSTGQKLGEKKAQGQMDGPLLDWALEAFSGYVAADALSEGPSCVLAAVDKRQ